MELMKKDTFLKEKILVKFGLKRKNRKGHLNKNKMNSLSVHGGKL